MSPEEISAYSDCTLYILHQIRKCKSVKEVREKIFYLEAALNTARIDKMSAKVASL
ncbi:MAG: hypothetical protein M1587_05530 [Thaumarchaeota archaeon]|nr:hypothetical protein [Nitrososphaerota archaeon]